MNAIYLKEKLNGINNNNSTVFLKNETIEVFEYVNGEVITFERFDKKTGNPVVTINMIEELLKLN